MDKVNPTNVVRTEQVVRATAKLDEITAPEAQREIPRLTKEQEIQKLARVMFNGDMRLAERYYHREGATKETTTPHSATEADWRMAAKLGKGKEGSWNFIERTLPERDRE